jgi:hypothetical protein
MAAALLGYEQQRSEILKKMAELRRQLGGRGASAAAGSSDGTRPARKKRPLSAAARLRIGAAQRKRWAAARKSEIETATPAAKPAKKRKLSAAGKRRIIAATKKRWAAFRAKKRAAGKKNAA